MNIEFQEQKFMNIEFQEQKFMKKAPYLSRTEDHEYIHELLFKTKYLFISILQLQNIWNIVVTEQSSCGSIRSMTVTSFVFLTQILLEKIVLFRQYGDSF